LEKKNRAWEKVLEFLAEWAVDVRLELIMVDAFLRCTEERGTGPEEIILVGRWILPLRHWPIEMKIVNGQ
jgi:hypothetical protein